MSEYNLDSLAFLEARRGLQKTIDSLSTHTAKQALKAELVALLKRYKEEYQVEEEIPDIEIMIQKNVAYFEFRNPKNGRQIYLVSDFLMRAKRVPNGRH